MTKDSDKTIDQDGLSAARRLAGWEIGDTSWADLIIRAYLYPEVANAAMDSDGIPARTGAFR